MSWYEYEPATSLHLIREISSSHSSIIDMGGGGSLLARRLVELGFKEVTVLDIAPSAVERARARSGELEKQIRWIVADVIELDTLPPCDVWHDRAVFHFLTGAEDRNGYITLAKRTIRPGGHMVVGVFALDGPDKCSGLPVERYDTGKLVAEFGPDFSLQSVRDETHVTPTGKAQKFTFAVFERKR